MEYLAHIAEDGRTQTVAEHLDGTGKLCAGFAAAFGAEEQGRYIGLAHDIGKCSAAFQERLKGGRVVDHATAGAFECAKADAIWAAGCVAGHHGGLPDFGNLANDASNSPTLYGRLHKAIEGKIPRYQLPQPLEWIPQPNHFGKSDIDDSFVVRMLYSCLVDADYLDTEEFMTGRNHTSGNCDSIERLLEKLKQYIEPWQNPENELNRKRCEVLHECLKGDRKEQGIYTLTVPTGGGKTIASIAFALTHALARGMSRIIYVIPYTSIIEQTADVFRRIFGDQNVVEHHSNAEYEIPEDGDSKQYTKTGAVENWNAPIIVTTAVQFFESMYANRPSKCRKLHNIANSVLIFDEAQMLPTEHLHPCVAAIAKMVSLFKVTAVLCTATQPVLNDMFQKYAPGYTITEICPDYKALFESLKRVTFHNIGKTDEDTIADQLCALPQVLCIVNSRKAAQELYHRLPEEGRFHLSTLLYPEHRRWVLAMIRDRLNKGDICRVVSTSLIEAGVDVDFPAVFRELAGLDSILQAAGRCNREGKRGIRESVVTVFSGLSRTPALQSVAVGATKEVLKEDTDPALPDTIERYYRAYRSLAGDRLDKYGVIAAFEDGIQGRSLPFRTIADRFRLISDDTKTVYIPLDEGEELVHRLKLGEHSRDLFRKLGRYGVSVYASQFDDLLESGTLELLEDDLAVLSDLSVYDQGIGLQFHEKSSDGFFI